MQGGKTSHLLNLTNKIRKIQIREENLFPCMTAHFKEPLLIEKGEMQYLFDHNGKKYLDLFGGIVTVSVGHCHPRVNQALIDQAQKLWHTTQIYWYEGIHKYAKQLADTLPEGLDQGKALGYFTRLFFIRVEKDGAKLKDLFSLFC